MNLKGVLRVGLEALSELVRLQNLRGIGLAKRLEGFTLLGKRLSLTRVISLELACKRLKLGREIVGVDRREGVLDGCSFVNTL